jgi:hypothetical protein
VVVCDRRAGGLSDAQEWFYQYKGKMTLKVIEDATVGQRTTTKEGLEARRAQDLIGRV